MKDLWRENGLLKLGSTFESLCTRDWMGTDFGEIFDLGQTDASEAGNWA